MSFTNTKPLALVILDGWGHSTATEGNAIALAHTPYYDEICAGYPMTTLAAAAGADVGHMNIGTGRSASSESDVVVEAIRSGAFFENELLVRTFAELAANGRGLHLVGLLSDGGVHSSTESLFALLRMAKRAGLESVYVHGILDGVDVPARTADVYVEALEIKLADIGVGRIATLCGRHFAMDSQSRWERTARAFTMLVHAEGELSNDAVGSIRNSFLRGISDEFIAPIILEYEPSVPVARIGNGDTVIFFNHRPEGMRQLVRSVSVPDASGAVKPLVSTVCLTEYDRDFSLPVAFLTSPAENVLSEVLGIAGVPNFKISQSERFPHVTFYFNGGTETQVPGETQVLVPSPSTDNSAMRPESQSFKITDTFLRSAEAVAGGVFVVNIPAADLAAASGKLDKAIDAVQFIDTCVGGILKFVREAGGIALVTSSHPGCETMPSANGSEPQTSTEPNPVPFHLISADNGVRLRADGTLADIAPTILGILGIEKPVEMTGNDLRIQ
ncbi:MAG: 2,3-bisphosphoglycerate-independent phosphoglycerate mutase [Acidobacteriota bacterium]